MIGPTARRLLLSPLTRLCADAAERGPAEANLWEALLRHLFPSPARPSRLSEKDCGLREMRG